MKLIWSFLFASLILPVGKVYAEPPNLITYQGRLKENNQPVTGNRTIEIFLCDAPAAGACSGSGPQGVFVSTGLFKSTFTVPGALNLSSGNWWLEVKVGAQVLSPREQLSSVPYALYAATAAYSTGLAAAAGATGVTASTHVYVINGGSLTVSGAVTALKYYGDGSALTGVSAADSTKVAKAGDTMTGPLTLAGSSLAVIAPDTVSSSLWVSTSASVPHLYVSTAGRVGVGLTNPGARLTLPYNGYLGWDANNTGDGYAAHRIGKSVTGATPLEFINDSNPGPLGRQFSFFYTGSELLSILAGGNVGVGTTAPDQKLTVAGNISQTGVLISSGTGNNYFAGRVGVGTTGPAELLHIYRPTVDTTPARLKLQTANADSFYINEWGYTSGKSAVLIGQNLYWNNTGMETRAAAANPAWGLTMSSEGDATMFTHFTGAGAKIIPFYINASGNIGIGTTSLEARLDVISSTSTAYSLSVGTSAAYSMVVSTSGNVGIGTASPANKLHLHDNGSSLVYLQATNASTGSSDFDGLKAGINGFGDAYLVQNEARPFSIQVSGAQRLRIESSGNVGVGTTGPLSKFDVLDGSITVRGTNAGLTLENASRVISPETDAALGAGIKASTNVYVVGFSSAAKYYGDGSALTGISMTGGVLKTGDAMTGKLTAPDYAATYGIAAATAAFTGSITAARYHIAGSTVLAISGADSLGVGVEAGRVNTGNNNSLVGYRSGFNNSTGWENSFVGSAAGFSNSIGSYNSFMGYSGGFKNSAGEYNSFVGSYAGYENTTGGYNSIMGSAAGYWNKTGSANAIFGAYAGYGTALGSFSSSTLVGYNAGYGLTTGNGNIFLGFQAGYNITTGTGNVIIGYNQNAPTPTTNNFLNLGGVLYGDLASGSVGIGTTGPSYRLHVSSGAGESGIILAVSTGASVVFGVKGNGEVSAGKYFGDGSGLSNISVSSSISVSTINATATTPYGGINVTTNTFIQGNVGIGTTNPNAFARLHVAGNIFLNSANRVRWGDANTFIEGITSPDSITIGTANTERMRITSAGNVGIGTTNPGEQLEVSGNIKVSSVIATGNISAASYRISGSTVLAVLQGAGSLGVGVNAGGSNTGSDNLFVGFAAGSLTQTGAQNSFIGSNAGYFNLSGGDNTFVGYKAGYNNSSAWENTMVGSWAGNSVSGGRGNTYMGYAAGFYNQTGYANVVIGRAAGGYGGAIGYFSSSTVMGYEAGYKLVTGSADNIFLGFRAGYNVTAGTGNIVIGYNKNTSAATANNELNIGGVLYGDLSAKTIGISTRVPQAALDIVSTGTAANIYAQIWRNSSGLVVASMSATGQLSVGGVLTDASKVSRTGDTMTGQLIVYSDILAYASDIITTGLVISTGGAVQTAGLGHGTTAGAARGLGAVDLQTSRELVSQVASGQYSAIGGGFTNTASGQYSVVSGGWRNTAWMFATTIGGGTFNTAASNSYATIAGGSTNTAGGYASFIGGGYYNNASGGSAAIAGGFTNTASGTGSFIGGGDLNNALGQGSVIGGGAYHTIDAAYGAVAGGKENKIKSDAYAGFIGGGERNISTGAYSTVGGGFLNTSSGAYSGVLGGYGNVADGSWSSVTGGSLNQAGYEYSAVAGGQNNRAWAKWAMVAGGYANTASGQYSAIIGGSSNKASGMMSFVAGGQSNEAGGWGAVAFGSNNASMGDFSFAAGYRSTAAANGAFTWSDSQGLSVVNDIPDQVRFKAKGGFWVSTSAVYSSPGLFVSSNNNVGIGTTGPTHKLSVEGGLLATSSITANGGFYGYSSTLTGSTSTLSGNAIVVSSSSIPMMIQAGSGALVAGTQTVTFPKSFRSGTLPIVVVVDTTANNVMSVTAVSNTQFTANSGGATDTYNWMAIGTVP